MNKIKNGKSFSELLSLAHVKGLIEEVLLTIEEGKGFIQAIDMTSCLFLSCEAKIEVEEDLELGINNLPMLIRFFEDSDEVNYTIQDEWIVLKKKKSRLKCILSPSDSIPTTIEETLSFKDLKKQCKNSIEFTQDMYAELTYYESLVHSNSLFVQSKKKKAVIYSNKFEEQQFQMDIGKAKKAKSCKVEVLSDHLLKVLSLVDWTKKVYMHFGSEVPLIIKQGSNFWALTPLTGEGA